MLNIACTTQFLRNTLLAQCVAQKKRNERKRNKLPPRSLRFCHYEGGDNDNYDEKAFF